jgi:putative transposase
MKIRSSTYGMKVVISDESKTWLYKLQRDGSIDSQTGRRARILELFSQGFGSTVISEMTGAGIATVGRARRRFFETDLDTAIFGYKAPGNKPLLDHRQKTKIVALACSDPPEGIARWSTRLLAEMSVSNGIVDSVGRETV